MKTIYWAPYTLEYNYTSYSMLNHEIEPLAKDLGLFDASSMPWMKCPAFLNESRNTFVVKNPVDFSFSYGDGSVNQTAGIPNIIRVRKDSPEQSMTLAYDMKYIFFSEDDISITQMPAFMHKNTFNQLGALIPGSFNINKWFRPIDIAIQAWDEHGGATLNAGDPLYYIKFNTDEKISLKRFSMSDELNRLVHGIVQHKQFEPKLPLLDLYSRFIRSGMQSKVLKEIKRNIV